MERRKFLKNTCIGTAALSLSQLQFCGKTGEKKPNIIFIMADDLGYGELGCYGQKIIKTPNINKLAAEGMKFTQFYAGSPVCAPSRCVLLTGKHTGHAYIRNNGRPINRGHNPGKGVFAGQNPLAADEVTIAEVLKKHGYVTGAIGKWGLGAVGTEGDPNKQGFDLFYGYNSQVQAHNHYPKYLWRNDKKEILAGNNRELTGKQYSQDLFIREAKKFIRKNKTRPFFLYLPFIVPHLSIQVPEDALAEYKGKIPETPYKHRGYLQHPYPHAGYAAMISRMDAGIGEIMALLKELGLDDQTIVFFTSDNGPTYNRLGGADSEFFNSTGPLRGRKGSVYEGGIRVPMIARWPGKITPDSQTHLPFAFWDVPPTLCELAGTKPPAQTDGISFYPTLTNNSRQKQHAYLYWEFPAYGGQQAVRMGDWKGVRSGLKKKNSDKSIRLYNLKDDIGEKNNVAAAHPEIVQKIREIMKTARSESKLFPFPETKLH